jgi:IPT/TIG domain
MNRRAFAIVLALLLSGVGIGCNDSHSPVPTGPSATPVGPSSPPPASSPALSITAVFPSMGVVTGGTQVEIVGAGLAVHTLVAFDGVRVPVRGWAPTGERLSVLTPAHAAGPVDVIVTNPNGQSSRLSAGFNYGSAAPLNLTALSTPVGLTAGGTYLSIGGTGLQPGLKVAFGNADARVIYSTPTWVTVATPPHVAGAVDVVVTTADGQVARLDGGYTYRAPRFADFNGVWEGNVGDEGELAFTFTVENNTLVNLSCGGRGVLLPSLPSTTGGEFSVAGNRGAALTGGLLSADSAEGMIDLAACTYHTVWTAKRR